MCDVRGNCSLIGPNLENDHSNSAEFSTKQTGSQALKHQNDIQLLFKIKHSGLTPLLILRSGTLPAVWSVPECD